MKLAEDERARVPFALIAILLLVSAGTVVYVQPNEITVEDETAKATERSVAAAETIVRDATQEAGAIAASAPVTDPEKDGFGQVLDDNRTFESYFELLTYREAEDRMQGHTVEIEETKASMTLPEIQDTTTAKQAIDKTTIESDGDGTVTATIEGVKLQAENEEYEVFNETRTISVTVPTPALMMHEKVEKFESKLDEGPVARSGLGAELSGRLYAMAWARGYAQYGGAPIADVLNHEHIELAAAGSAIDLQEEVFGTADPEAKEGLVKAGADLAADELLPDRWSGIADAALPDPNTNPDSADEIDSPGLQSTEISVDILADEAYHEIAVKGDTVETIIDDAHEVETRIEAETEKKQVNQLRAESPRGPEWQKISEESSFETISVEQRDEAEIPASGHWQTIETKQRTVTIERTVNRTWLKGSELRESTDIYKETHAVGIGIYATSPSVAYAPAEGIYDIDTPGNPPSGAVGPSISDAAIEKQLDKRGSVDEVAEEAVVDTIDTEPKVIEVEPPEAVQAWVYDDIASLRDTVRTLSVEVDQTEMVTSAQPTSQLKTVVEKHEEQLVNKPDQYESRAQKALIGARSAYLDHLLDHLNDDTEETASIQDALSDQIDRIISGPEAAIDDLIQRGMDHTRPEPADITADPPAENLSLAVESDPSHLTKAEVTTTSPRVEREEYHPLSMRTATVASLPADRIVEALADRLLTSDETVSPEVAARVMLQADKIPADITPSELQENKQSLYSELETVKTEAKQEAVQDLAEPTTLGYVERYQAVEKGLSNWDTDGGQILAMSNGTAAEAIAEEVETKDKRTYAADRAESTLRVTFSEHLTDEDVEIPEGPVTDVADKARSVAEDTAEDVIEDHTEKVKDRLDQRLNGGLSMAPAGVPLLPKPGAWWATANAWTVELEGEYASFAVRSPQGSPETGGQVTYVRSNEEVEMDMTGNGMKETIGSSERISFDTWTTVVVVVPPGKSGVGNMESDGIESSNGW